jgi:L-alanine-DL-glutamate epimerase-like enolase superfamily enzyme
MIAGLMVSARIERWPIKGAFTIARGTKTEAEVIVVELTDGQITGRGECVPYARYGETTKSVMAQIRGAYAADREGLRTVLPAGAARNGLDCAMWDFEAKIRDSPAPAMAGAALLQPLLSAYTLSLNTPEVMASRAANAGGFPLLKLKLGADGDDDRLYAIREARPDARLIVDANEGWRRGNVASRLGLCAEVGVEVVEQPLPAEIDSILEELPKPVPVCADESAHTAADIARLARRYEAVNIKLDKAGGLTEGLAMLQAARAVGLKVMVGCMVSTSLAMAPALILAQNADWVDLDGPLLLKQDRTPGLSYVGAFIRPPSPALWG